MAWLSIIGNVLYYLSRPIMILLNWLMVILAPVLYLGHYISWTFLLPLRLIAKFETIYIFLGVAAIIGLATGSVLHFSSTILASLFNINTNPKESGLTAVSGRALHDFEKLESAWQRSTIRRPDAGPRSEAVAEGYPKRPRDDVNYRTEDQGLLSQTILEEDDSDGLI